MLELNVLARWAKAGAEARTYTKPSVCTMLDDLGRSCTTVMLDETKTRDDRVND